MQFTITRENLLNALQMIMGAVEKRQTMPILGNALLTLSDNKLVVIATDLEIELQGIVDVESVIEEGKITVPARKILDICRALPENKQISLVLEGDNLLVSCERSRFKLVTLPADDFPNVEEGISTDEFTIAQSVLHDLIERVYFSMAQQDVRYYLNGMLFIKSAGLLRVVTTDGHRLSLCSYPGSFGESEVSNIIPRKAITELMRLLTNNEEEVIVNLGDNHLRITAKNHIFISKLIDGVFPDYQKVIPKNISKQISIDKELFKQVLSRIAILSNEKYRGVKLCFEAGKLAVEAHNSEHEEAYEELSIDYDAEALEIGFNVSYLLDAINALPKGNIRLSMSDGNSSIQIESEEDSRAIYVVMPMRI